MITGSVSSSPVSSTVQVVVLPLPSSAVMVMLCVVPSPEAMLVPAIGDCVISTDASQLSVAAASATRSGTVIWQVAFSGRVLSNGQVVITGLVSSSPVSTTVQVVVLPLPSSAVMVMLCVVPSPEAISVPAIGDCVISTDASQLSVAAASATRSGTVIWQVPFRDKVRSAGQVVITGSVSSSPVSTTVQVVVLPLPSSAVMVMLCVVPSPEAISGSGYRGLCDQYRCIAVIGGRGFCHQVGYCDLAGRIQREGSICRDRW